MVLLRILEALWVSRSETWRGEAERIYSVGVNSHQQLYFFSRVRSCSVKAEPSPAVELDGKAESSVVAGSSLDS